MIRFVGARTTVFSMVFMLALSGCHKQPRIATLPPPAQTAAAPAKPSASRQAKPALPQTGNTWVSKNPMDDIVLTDKQVDPPRLGLMLSAEEQQRLVQAIDADLRRTAAFLAEMAQKPLTAAQKDVVRQIHSFVDQTEELRKTDLGAAKGLAYKAALLAQDLVRGKK